MTDRLPDDEVLIDGQDPRDVSLEMEGYQFRRTAPAAPGERPPDFGRRGEFYQDAREMVAMADAGEWLAWLRDPETRAIPRSAGHDPIEMAREAGGLLSAVATFGKSLVVDALFDAAGYGLAAEIDGRTRSEWKRALGVQSPRQTQPLVDPDRIPTEVNGWEYVGVRGGDGQTRVRDDTAATRVIWSGGDPPADTEGRAVADPNARVYIEATQATAPSRRPSDVTGLTFAVIREIRPSDFGRDSSRREFVADRLPSLDAALDVARGYMEENDPYPRTAPAELLTGSETKRQLTAHYALADLLGRPAGRDDAQADPPFDSTLSLLRALERYESDNSPHSRIANTDTDTFEAVVDADERIPTNVATTVLRYLGARHPDLLVWAREQAESSNRDRFPFEQTRGDWGDLQPQSGGSSLSRTQQGTLSGGGRASDRTRKGRQSSSGRKKTAAQRDLTEQYGDRDAGLDEYGIDVGDVPDDDDTRDAQQEARAEARRRGQYRRGETPEQQRQQSLTGDEAINRDLAQNIEKSRRRARNRPNDSKLVDSDAEREQAELTEGQRAVRDALEDDDDEDNGGEGR